MQHRFSAQPPNPLRGTVTGFSPRLHIKGSFRPNETPDVIHPLLRAPPLFSDLHREQRGGAGAPSDAQRSGLPQRPAIPLLQRHRRLAANPGIDQPCWDQRPLRFTCQWVSLAFLWRCSAADVSIPADAVPVHGKRPGRRGLLRRRRRPDLQRRGVRRQEQGGHRQLRQ